MQHSALNVAFPGSFSRTRLSSPAPSLSFPFSLNERLISTGTSREMFKEHVHLQKQAPWQLHFFFIRRKCVLGLGTKENVSLINYFPLVCLED